MLLYECNTSILNRSILSQVWLDHGNAPASQGLTQREAGSDSAIQSLLFLQG